MLNNVFLLQVLKYQVFYVNMIYTVETEELLSDLLLEEKLCAFILGKT